MEKERMQKRFCVGLFVFSETNEGHELFAYVVSKARHSAKTGEMRRNGDLVEAMVHGELGSFGTWMYFRRWFRTCTLLRYIFAETGPRMAWHYFRNRRHVQEIETCVDFDRRNNIEWHRTFFALYVPRDLLYKEGDKGLIQHIRPTSLGFRRVVEHEGRLHLFRWPGRLIILRKGMQIGFNPKKDKRRLPHGKHVQKTYADGFRDALSVFCQPDTEEVLLKAFEMIRRQLG